MDNHISSEDLELYLLNRTEPSMVDAIEKHMLNCEVCQDAALRDAMSFAAMRIALQSLPSSGDGVARQFALA
jgi:hypothetical protein